MEASGGLLLLACAVIALVLANAATGPAYAQFWQEIWGIRAGSFSLQKPLLLWVNDLLMAVFFLVIGLEIKREVLVGELSSVRMAMLPMFAAIGGMVVPALIFVGLNPSYPARAGWGIPMATDIAFSLGILALFGRRIPTGLKIFLAALAIVDDLGAVLVIAIFYASDIHMGMLQVGLGVYVFMALLSRAGVRSMLAYGLLGLALWYCCLKGGIHATIAGVLTATVIPARSKMNTALFTEQSRDIIERFGSAGKRLKDSMLNVQQDTLIRSLETLCERYGTPLQKLENTLHPWAAYCIMPVFALANAGVVMSGGLSSISWGVGLGLAVGKPVGIVIFSLLAVKFGLAGLPRGVNWGMMVGVGFLAGIGFTMSLFITSLAYDNVQFTDQAKIGVLAGSLVSGVVGSVLLVTFSSKRRSGLDALAEQGEHYD